MCDLHLGKADASMITMEGEMLIYKISVPVRDALSPIQNRKATNTEY
jgi:hypothetical protein